jgi:predicted dehydrogenase
MWAGPPDYSGTFDVDDYAAGFVRFGDAATLSFEVAWACNSKEEAYLELLGTKAGIKIGAGGGGDLVFLTEVDDRIADVAVKYNSKCDKFAAEVTSFVKAVKGEGEPAATGEEGVTNMRLIDAIYASAASGAEVAV